ncbi:hypothetical protein [Stutzerimonas stutzeri]|uniref:hypothetical protein n=1 Tax=Stutzerimonas stutzeri TaxID=316 RepID=UPI00210CA12C|nr:hypothetical protein [Stutzerimonas stutzeri]MCQ4321515.1 hypothetical protein [Stutzerimonas stutzeri]
MKSSLVMFPIHQMNSYNFDLNLLRVLDMMVRPVRPDAQQARHRRRQRCRNIRFDPGQQLVLEMMMEWRHPLHSFCAVASRQKFTRARVFRKSLG